MSAKKKKILFVCFGNMIRSQMAEGFARDAGSAFLDVYSAGLHPQGIISPEAVVVMEEKNIDITGQHSKGLRDVPLDEMDYVVSLLEQPARDFCPKGFKGEMLDWYIEDPLGGSFNQFRVARDDIETRVKDFIKKLWKESTS